MNCFSRMVTFLCILTGVLLFITCPVNAVTQFLATQEEKATPPDPAALEILWWQYFSIEPQALQSRIDAFLSSIKTIGAKATPENQEEIIGLISKIEANLKALAQARNQVPPKLSTAAAHANKYSIERALDLNRQIRKKSAVLKTDQDNLADRIKQSSIAEELLEKLVQDYRRLDGRNETKLIAGLKLIALQLNLDVAKIRITHLQQVVANGEEELKRLKQEATVAANTLSADKSDRDRLLKAATDAESVWTTALAELHDKEINHMGSLSFGQQTEKAKLENHLQQEELLLASVKEALAYHRFLFKQIELNLTILLAAPAEMDLNELGQSIKKWQKWTDQLQQKARDWERLFQREVQRPEGSSIENETKSITNLRTQVFKQIQSNQTLVQHLLQEIEDNRALMELTSKYHASSKGMISKWFSDAIDFICDAFQTTLDIMNSVLFYIGSTPVTIASLMRCLLIMVGAFWVSRLVLRGLTEIAQARNDIKKSVVYRINRLVHYLILMLGALLALSSIGFDFSNLALIAGALGVGLGFGLQSIFNNFISGIIILFESQLKVGDLIELESGLRGEVKEINVRSTHIKTTDGIAVIVPNSEFIEGKVVNWTLEDPYRRVHVPFSVSYHSNKDLVIRVVEEAAQKVHLTLPKGKFPGPRVYITKLGDHGIECELAVWIDDTVTKGNLLPFSLYSYTIHDALIRNGIESATPQTEVHIARIMDKVRWDNNPAWPFDKHKTAHDKPISEESLQSN